METGEKGLIANHQNYKYDDDDDDYDDDDENDDDEQKVAVQ